MLEMKWIDYNSMENLSALEAKANRYTVKCQINSFLILTAVWLLNVLNIFIIDAKLMNISYIISAIITLACWIVCRFFPEDKPWIKYVLLLLTVMFSTTVGIFLTYQAVLVAAIPLCYSMQYYKKKMVFYTYGLTIVGILFSTMAGYFVGLCDANMLVLTTGPMAQYVEKTTGMAVFDAVNANPWGTLPLYYALPRCMILFAIIIIASHAVGTSARKAIREVELKRLSEKDGMTGLYNRNKYLSMLETYYPKVDRVGVLFWDADGLKKVNDTYGHEVGDNLIALLGSSIQEFCSDTKRGYRIGGDEFVLIMENADETELCKVMNEWESRFSEMNRQTKNNFFASVGGAVGAGKEIEDVVRCADEQMYLEKRKRGARN